MVAILVIIILATIILATIIPEIIFLAITILVIIILVTLAILAFIILDIHIHIHTIPVFQITVEILETTETTALVCSMHALNFQHKQKNFQLIYYLKQATSHQAQLLVSIMASIR